MDYVYVVKETPTSGSATLELRYSLRSLSNLPRGEVFIAGFKPTWLRNVTHIPTVQRGTKFLNAYNNLVAALSHVGETFVLMNDDFFVMKPLSEVPVLHREKWGSSENLSRSGPYQQAKSNVGKLLKKHGIAEVTSYELHVPMVYNRDLLKDTVEKAKGTVVAGYQRTLYGNLNRIGGTFMSDCKVSSNRLDWLDWPFVSTSDRAFVGGKVGAVLKKRFPEPSIYECP